MKIFIAALLVASVASSPRIDSRIASGTEAKADTAKCYVTLVIESEYDGIKSCGGCLLAPEDRIITSASCVISPKEGKLTSIKVFPGIRGSSGTEAKNEILDIYPFYDYKANSNVSRGDVAVITFAERFKTVKGSFEANAMITGEDKVDAFVGQHLVVCGMGNTDNKKSKPKALMCTTLRVVPTADCEALLAPPPSGESTTAAAADATTGAPAGPKKGIICTKNLDEKNACGGDIGAPVFLNQTGFLSMVGVVSLYPDARPNARCLDGHHVVITQLAAFKDFLNEPTKPAPTTVAPTTLAG